MTKLGTVLDGKYEILKKVGQGGMSIVYLAMDNRLNKQWAVKEIKNDGSKSTATLLKGLEREANILKDVDHPVLPRIVDIINENGTIYVVMDFVEGRPLSDVLKAEGAQNQEKVIEWGRALASALDYLHSMNPPIIYRDMKPSNVMLKPDGSVKLIDFGTAKEYIVENNADTTALGTRGYAAPEQFGDSQGHGIYNTDARTDIYNLGATLYHLVTGKNPCEPPYEIKPIRQWNPMLSSGFERIIQKCCQPSPEDRYQSCSELLYALDHYNELDDAYKAKAKQKIAVFSIMAGLSLISAGCAVVGGIKKNQLRELDYNNKVNEARDAVDNGDYNTALADYKDAVEIDPKASDAYIGYMETYAYYITDTDQTSANADSSAVKGIRLALKNIDEVQDDVKFKIAMLYYNEDNNYSSAKQYFNMVDDSKDFPEEAKQAKYYAAMCDSILNKSASFADNEENLYAFQEYNSNAIDDTNPDKYTNYMNIAAIYGKEIEKGDNSELVARLESMLDEAMKNLDNNAETLNNLFPSERGVKYYNGQYAARMYSVYIYLAEHSEDDAQKVSYYNQAASSVSIYLGSLDVAAENATDTAKKAYAEYAVREAETFIQMAVISKNTSYYDEAEKVFTDAESVLGQDDNAASVYIGHLSYIVNRYTEEMGNDSAKWSAKAVKAVKTVYEEGNKIPALKDGLKNQWNSLKTDLSVKSIVDGK